jgi:biotin carboxyl carrier protein
MATIPALRGTDIWGEALVRWALPLVLGGMTSLIALAVICLYVIRFSLSVSAAGVLEPESTRTVYSPTSGLIGAVRVRPGDAVAQGDVVAILVIFPLRSQVRTPRLQPPIADPILRTPRGQPTAPNRPFADIESEVKLLEIRSPSDGTIMAEHLSERAGQTIGQGELVCEVGAATGWNVDALSVAADLRRVRVGDTAVVTLSARARPWAPVEEGLSGQIVSIHSEPSRPRSSAAAAYHLRVRLNSTVVEAGGLCGLQRGAAAALRITTQPVRAIDLMVDHLRDQIETWHWSSSQ